MEQGKAEDSGTGKDVTHGSSVTARENFSSEMRALLHLFKESAESRIDLYDSQIENAWSELDEEQSRREDIQGELWGKEHEVDSLSARVNTQIIEIAVLKQEKEALGASLAEQQIENTTLARQLRDREEEHEEDVKGFKKDSKIKDSEIDRLRHELTAYQRRLHDQSLAMGDVYSKFTRQESDSAAMEASPKSRIRILEAELTIKSRDMDIRIEQLDAANTELAKMKADNAAEKLEASERKNYQYAQIIVDLHAKVEMYKKAAISKARTFIQTSISETMKRPVASRKPETFTVYLEHGTQHQTEEPRIKRITDPRKRRRIENSTLTLLPPLLGTEIQDKHVEATDPFKNHSDGFRHSTDNERLVEYPLERTIDHRRREGREGHSESGTDGDRSDSNAANELITVLPTMALKTYQS